MTSTAETETFEKNSSRNDHGSIFGNNNFMNKYILEINTYRATLKIKQIHFSNTL